MSNSNSPKLDGMHDAYEIGNNKKVTKMGKMNTLWLILQLIFIGIFNVFFFVLGGTEHGVSVWMSYGFIHFSYWMLLLTPRLTRKGKSAAVFGFALYSISAVYFFVALITGIVFILIAPDGYTVALLVQLSIAGLYGIMLISHLIANEKTADAELERQPQIDYVKNASAQMKSILDSIKDKDAKKKVERVYDILNSSPVKSHHNLAQMEMRILTMIDELGDAVSSEDKEGIIATSDSLMTAANERNRKLKGKN